MDISFSLSIVIGFACVLISILMGGKVSDFWDLPSIFIVLGGVACATAASFPPKRLKSLFKALGVISKNKKYDLGEDINKIVEIANIARQNGLLALEQQADSIDEPFLQKGIMLAVDGSDSELIRSIMETELSVTKERHANNRAILDAAAGYAPAFGMIGTLIGLINMLAHLSDSAKLGSSMSVALVTTFYGSMLANLVFTPMSKRLKALGANEYLHKELILEGILAIQNGENPRIIREKLNAYRSNATQKQQEELKEKNRSGEAKQ